MARDARRVLLAPDSFKGTLSAAEVANALARGVCEAGLPVDLAPIADGGDGTMAVLVERLGGAVVSAEAHDALGRVCEAQFALLAGGERAVIDVASASGLARLKQAEYDAEGATSAGTGELILAAIDAGATTILLAAGGSATTDGGHGILTTLEDAGGLGGARLVVLCDVRTPFECAAARFARQKGADAPALARLRRRLDTLAETLPRDPRGIAMGGAGGGLAGGLWAALGAALEPGAAFVLGALDFDRRLRAARAVVVGEGRLDATTLEGKAPGEVAVRARQAGVPAHAVCARNQLDAFDARILDLQMILEASTVAELECAGATLASAL